MANLFLFVFLLFAFFYDNVFAIRCIFKFLIVRFKRMVIRVGRL